MYNFYKLASLRGHSLIEVLVALALFGMGMLVLANSNVAALNHQREGSFFALAVLQAQNGVELIKAGGNEALSLWQQQLPRLLPAGAGDIYKHQAIQVSWHLPHHRPLATPPTCKEIAMQCIKLWFEG